MTNQQKQLELAIKEIQKAKEKYDTLYREFNFMKLYSKDLEKEIKELKEVKKESSMRNHSKEADEAMRRYTARLKKEGLKYAKQKQSKRKQARKTSSESSKGTRDQSNSSICK